MVNTAHIFDDAAKGRIEQAIRKLELRSTGEMVCAVAPASSNYRMAGIVVAALVALLCPLLDPLMALVSGARDWHEPLVTFPIQIVVFAVLAALLTLTDLRVCITSRRTRRALTDRYAQEQFFRNNLQNTEGHTGILLFVSLAEHHAEIIADKGINDRVPENTWQAIIDTLTADIKAGQVEQGFIKAVESCAALLEKHFPAGQQNRNELPDRVVLLQVPTA